MTPISWTSLVPLYYAINYLVASILFNSTWSTYLGLTTQAYEVINHANHVNDHYESCQRPLSCHFLSMYNGFTSMPYCHDSESKTHSLFIFFYLILFMFSLMSRIPEKNKLPGVWTHMFHNDIRGTRRRYCPPDTPACRADVFHFNPYLGVLEGQWIASGIQDSQHAGSKLLADSWLFWLPPQCPWLVIKYPTVYDWAYKRSLATSRKGVGHCILVLGFLLTQQTHGGPG